MPHKWQILPTPQPPKPYYWNPYCDFPRPPPPSHVAFVAELNALDAYENKRRGDLAKERMAWEKADYLEAKTTQERAYGYIDGMDWYDSPEYAGLHWQDRWIKREDLLVSEEAHVSIYRKIGTARMQANERMYGYSWWGMEQDRIQKEKELKAEEHYQTMMAKKEYEEKLRREWRWKLPTFGLTSNHVSGASGFFLALLVLLLGLLWFLVRGLAWVVVMGAKTAATTFWNRYMEYDVAAAEQRSDSDILNAQFQSEIFDSSSSHQQTHNRHQSRNTGETSWTGSAFDFLISLLHAIHRLLVAIVYSIHRLLKTPFHAIWSFVRNNGSTSLLLLLVVLLIFNPWRPHPARMYVQNQLTHQTHAIVSSPPPRPSRFTPTIPEVNLSAHPNLLPTIRPIPTPTRKATRPATIQVPVKTIRKWSAVLGLPTDTEFGSAGWRAQEEAVRRFMMMEEWQQEVCFGCFSA